MRSKSKAVDVKFDIGPNAIGFLVWFRNQYKVWTGDCTTKIARRSGFSYKFLTSVLQELADKEYLKISVSDDRQSPYKRIVALNLLKYNMLVQSHVFQKNLL